MSRGQRVVVVQPNGNMWSVRDNGVTKSNHRKKRRAVEKAKRLGRKHGSTVEIRRQNGTVQDRVSY